jgi:ABC-type Fe3+ transport system substrate-binding protein
VRAIKGGIPATANFENYAGPLTETILLGNLAVWAASGEPGQTEVTGKKIEWDAAKLEAKNAPEVAHIVKPEYRVKLVMPHPTGHTLTTQWLSSLDKIMPKQRVEKFIRDLAAAKPVFAESIVPAADKVGSGEVAIGITFARFVLTYNKQGANLDYIRDYNMLGDGQYINIGAKPARPAAGKAFIDFFLDEESMKIQADTGEFVNRKGVYPPLQDADKIKFVQMYQFTKEDYETKKKEYQKIFFQ